jgi:hypothetical protein
MNANSDDAVYRKYFQQATYNVKQEKGTLASYIGNYHHYSSVCRSNPAYLYIIKMNNNLSISMIQFFHRLVIGYLRNLLPFFREEVPIYRVNFNK